VPVLVIDDNATNRRVLEETLAGWGMAPATADGPATGLESLRHAARAGHPFPVLLLDAALPEGDGFAFLGQVVADPELRVAPILMLPSTAREDEMARGRQLGVIDYLVKPVRRAELLGAVERALGVVGAASPEAARPRPGREQNASAEGRLRILVAEDNAVNQKLVVRLLEKRGHTVAVAGDGREALKAVADGAFDLVLMDIQMPVMDGFQTAAAIRQSEAGTGQHLPVIALTANAMKGDREQCLQGGFDGYVAKPVSARQLFQAIGRVLGPGRDPGPQGPIEADGVAGIRDAILARLGCDERVLRQIVAQFTRDCPGLMERIAEAIARKDPAALEYAAHLFKGSVGYFESTAARDSAGRLEAMGRSGDLARAGEAYADLQTSVASLWPAIDELLAEPVS
jgi:CheY-like chemotaxis protein/HPt (histidine-containing phosphotransfer) domain-containing protein